MLYSFKKGVINLRVAFRQPWIWCMMQVLVVDGSVFSSVFEANDDGYQFMSYHFVLIFDDGLVGRPEFRAWYLWRCCAPVWLRWTAYASLERKHEPWCDGKWYRRFRALFLWDSLPPCGFQDAATHRKTWSVQTADFIKPKEIPDNSNSFQGRCCLPLIFKKIDKAENKQDSK